MLLQFRKNTVADYQQVTDIEILPDFQNNFPSMDFIAKKLRYEKSKCHEKQEKRDKMLILGSKNQNWTPKTLTDGNKRGVNDLLTRKIMLFQKKVVTLQDNCF